MKRSIERKYRLTDDELKNLILQHIQDVTGQATTNDLSTVDLEHEPLGVAVRWWHHDEFPSK